MPGTHKWSLKPAIQRCGIVPNCTASSKPGVDLSSLSAQEDEPSQRAAWIVLCIGLRGSGKRDPYSANRCS